MSTQLTSAAKRRAIHRTWLLCSCLLSALILGWAFSLPFRNNEFPSNSQEEIAERSASGELGPPANADDLHSDAEAYRAAAIAVEKEFMAQVKKRNQPKAVPGLSEARRQFSRRAQRATKQLAELGNPEEGTLEWVEQQSLIQLLEDAPL